MYRLVIFAIIAVFLTATATASDFYFVNTTQLRNSTAKYYFQMFRTESNATECAANMTDKTFGVWGSDLVHTETMCTSRNITSLLLNGDKSKYAAFYIAEYDVSRVVTSETADFQSYYLMNTCIPLGSSNTTSWQKITCNDRIICADSACSKNCSNATAPLPEERWTFSLTSLRIVFEKCGQSRTMFVLPEEVRLRIVDSWALANSSGTNGSAVNAYVMVNATAQERRGICAMTAIESSTPMNWVMGHIRKECTALNITRHYLGEDEKKYLSTYVSRIGNTTANAEDYDYAYHYLLDQCIAVDSRGKTWQKITCDGRLLCSDSSCSSNCTQLGSENFPNLGINLRGRTVNHFRCGKTYPYQDQKKPGTEDRLPYDGSAQTPRVQLWLVTAIVGLFISNLF